MNKIKLFFMFAAVAVSLTARAQFRQDRSDFEYMFKAEIGYMPFVMNLGDAGASGYYISDLQHAAGASVINGVNIKQDFFVGIGLGYSYVAVPKEVIGGNFANGWHCPMAFIDFDYRPLDVEWSPMVGAKAGASYLMADSPYGNTLTPYVELSAGLNWFFRYEYRNMERNYLSLYLELAFAYTQQAVFIPVRLGFRF
ncbi:MAG: hypothetical protein J6031_03305 [Bacteroidales bacterium]|nr:hypothetical protein [Bacteroidales bacterium]